MNIREMRKRLNISQKEFAQRYHIPYRTVQNWETGVRIPPQYIIDLLEKQVMADMINRKTIALPEYSTHKKNLPKRCDYVGVLSWLRAVRDCLGDNVVFALDEALMCQNKFGGHNEEYVIWVYGDDSLSKYNGVVVIGNQISEYDINEKNGLRYTSFNRTISDALANENILDMQGITEAISKYYYQNGNSFDGIFVVPEYQKRFEELTQDAIEYYDE